MNIAIIDDIASDAEQLKRIITSYFENRQIPTEIRYFSSAEAFFDVLSARKFPDPVSGYLYGWHYRHGSSQKNPKSV